MTLVFSIDFLPYTYLYVSVYMRENSLKLGENFSRRIMVVNHEKSYIRTICWNIALVVILYLTESAY